MNRLSRVISFLGVAILIVLIVEFPHGIIRPETTSYTQPIHVFSWASFWSNMERLWYGITHLSLGRTLATRQNILPLVFRNAWKSVVLVGIALILTLILGVSKGIYDGVHSHRDHILSILSLAVQWLLEALPNFFVIISLVTISFWAQFALHLNVYVIGAKSFLTGTLVPAFVLSLGPIFYLSRAVRTSVEAQYGQAYLVTAQSKGLQRRQLILRHVLPNCLHAVRTSILPVSGLLFSGLILVEYLLYQPGLMSGLFGAMGNTGAVPSYGVPFEAKGAILSQFNNFDRNLVLGYLMSCVLVFGFFYGLLRLVLLVLRYRNVVNPYASTLRQRSSKFIQGWHGGVGFTMLAVIVFASVFANHLGLPNPNKFDSIHIIGNKMTVPPFPPSQGHWLGTDMDGRDLLSRALHFTLPTLYYVELGTMCTVGVGTLFGFMSSVLRIKSVRFIVETWNGCVTVIPGVLGALLILEIPTAYWAGIHLLPNGNSYWGSLRAVLVLAVAGLFESGKVSYTVQNALDDILKKDFIEAAIIAGNSRWSLFRLHLRRTLTETVLEQLLVEFNQIIILIAVLGYFQINLAPAWMKVNWSTWVFLDTSHDLGGLFSQNAHDFLAAPWVLLAPALFVAWIVFAVNLVLEWTRRRLQSV